MSTVETRYEHICFDRGANAVIEGANMKVVELVLEKMAYGWSPEELKFQHPFLTMGQIHSALAYFWDHREKFEREIENRLKHVDKLRGAIKRPPLVNRCGGRDDPR